MVEGSHFDARLSPSDVGYKAIAVSVSDVVAMGGVPQWALLTLTLPRDTNPLDFVNGFAEGVREACATFGVRLVGGDVTGGRGPRVVTSVVAGPCPKPVTRSGAQPGDDVWITGLVGLAGAGWMWPDPPPLALDRLRRPRPRLAFAQPLSDLATAAMDLSDGIATDLPRLALASGVAISIDLAALPVPDALLGFDPDQIREAQLCGGEDYELLFTASADRRDALLAQAEAVGVRLSRVGTVQTGEGVTTTEGPLPRAGFAHFDFGAEGSS